MRYLVSLCLSAIILLAPLAARGLDVREQRPNLIGAELAGRGLYYTINYERYLSNRVGIGAAAMAVWWSSDRGVYVPLYVSFIPVGNIHSLYLSAGVGIWVGESIWTDVAIWGNSDVEVLVWPTITIGYQFQSESGFFLRLSISSVGLWAAPGVAIGGSF